jgi:hypothetical protein
VRKLTFVRDQLNILEELEDRANLNLTNMEALNNFIAGAKTIRTALSSKFPEHFVDPASL